MSYPRVFFLQRRHLPETLGPLPLVQSLQPVRDDQPRGAAGGVGRGGRSALLERQEQLGWELGREGILPHYQRARWTGHWKHGARVFSYSVVFVGELDGWCWLMVLSCYITGPNQIIVLPFEFNSFIFIIKTHKCSYVCMRVSVFILSILYSAIWESIFCFEMFAFV